MSPVWKPRIDPPKLDKFCHLSHDAQRVMLALYSDYLQQRANIVETQQVISDPKNYYQSIYEARFGSGLADHSKVASSNGKTPFKQVDSSFLEETEETASTSSHQLTARRLDFRNIQGHTAERGTNTSIVQDRSDPGFQNTTPAVRKMQLAKTLHCPIVSPDVSNYSDSPPVETHDFRILSQFQRDDTISTLSSQRESCSHITDDMAMTDNRAQYSTREDFHSSLVEFDSHMNFPGQVHETSANGSFEIQLHGKKSAQNDFVQSYSKPETMDNPGNELDECPVSPSLFSQDVQRTDSRTAHSAQRKTAQKHCEKLQKSYELHGEFAGHNNSDRTASKMTKSQSEDLTVADFNKKLIVSPEGELKMKCKLDKQSSPRQAGTNKRIGQTDDTLCFLNRNIAKDRPCPTSHCSVNASKVLNNVQQSVQDMNKAEESEDPLVRDSDTTDKKNNTYSRAAIVERAENPVKEKPRKVFPIFNKPDTSANQSLRSVKNNDQVKRKPGCSQGFDAPFKKQKTMVQRLNQQTHTSYCPVDLVNIADLPSSELSQVLSECLEAEEVAISLIYSDGATQLRANMFGQETKKRQSGRQKMQDSSVSDIALGTQTSGYRRVYIFPVSRKHRELHWTLKKFWEELKESPRKKVGFNTKSLFIELMRVCDTENKKASRQWSVLDASIGIWLLDPDKPVTTLEQAASRLGLPPQEPSDSSLKALSSDMLLLRNVSDKLYQELEARHLLDVYLDLETPLTPLLAAMECREIHVATHTLLKLSEILKKKLQKLEHQAHQVAGHPFLLSSHAQLRQVLFETLRLDLKLPQKTKLAKTTVGRETSTSETVLHQLSPHHPLPGIVLEHRQLQKLKSTYVDGILSCVCEGRLRTHWDQTAAATGRLTSHQPNVQAIPKTPVTITHYKDNFIVGKEDTEEVDIYARDCFVSRPGYTLLAADFQQIELRLLAHLTRDPVLIQIFSDLHIPDIFNALTAQWLGKTQEVTASEREQTKRVVYSVMYGVGKDKLADYLKISSDTARGIMTSFLVKFPAVNQFTKACVEFCQKHGFTETIFKRCRLFPNMKHPSAALRAQAERQCVNFCIQGSAADLCKAAMLRLDQAFIQRRELDVRLLVQIHDELLFEVADQDLHSVTALVTEVMESRDRLCGSLVSLSVPIPVSVSVGKSWGHMNTVADTNKTCSLET